MFSTLRAKVAAGFTVLVIINVVVSAWSIYNFNQLTEAITTMIRQNYQDVIAAQNMLRALESDNSAQLLMLGGYPDAGYIQFQDNHRSFVIWFNQAVASNTSQNGADILQHIYNYYVKYSDATDTLKSIITRRGHRAALDYNYTNISPIFDKMKLECFKLLDMNHNEMVQTDTKASSISNQATMAVLGAALLAIVLSIVASWQFGQYVSQPAEKLTDTVRKFGRGYWDARENINSNDEIGELSHEFNRMAERLQKYEELNIEKLITEKKKSEAIVGTISDSIIVVDNEKKIVLMNQLAEDLFNVNEEAAIGKPFKDIVNNPELNNYMDRAGSESLSNLPPYFELRVDNEERYFRIKLNSSKGASGKIVGTILILQDVTQFKELDKMKSEFMARVSHEFRTPLTSINMSLDILKDEHIGHVNKKQRELLVAAKQDADRLTKLIRELLELSRLESGKIQLKEDAVDIRSLLDFSVHPALVQFNNKNVKLIVNADDSIPQFVADFQQLSWVISNLVTNALRFTNSGGAVTIDTTMNGDDMVISVRDTGCGIEPEMLDKVFDKFVQLHDSFADPMRGTSPSPGSVGLGLAIAKEIVELCGGKIWVDSKIGFGTVFTFSIPLNKRAIDKRRISA